MTLDSDVRQVCEMIGSECRVRLSGRITIDSSPDLRTSLLARLEDSDCRILTVDLFDVDYIDTSGLATVVEVLRAARAKGRTFRLTGLRDRPKYLLEATRLLHLFNEDQE